MYIQMYRYIHIYTNIDIDIVSDMYRYLYIDTHIDRCMDRQMGRGGLTLTAMVLFRIAGRTLRRVPFRLRLI